MVHGLSLQSKKEEVGKVAESKISRVCQPVFLRAITPWATFNNVFRAISPLHLQPFHDHEFLTVDNNVHKFETNCSNRSLAYQSCTEMCAHADTVVASCFAHIVLTAPATYKAAYTVTHSIA